MRYRRYEPVTEFAKGVVMKEGKSLFSISEIGGFLKGKTLLKDDGVCGTYESNGEILWSRS